MLVPASLLPAATPIVWFTVELESTSAEDFESEISDETTALVSVREVFTFPEAGEKALKHELNSISETRLISGLNIR